MEPSREGKEEELICLIALSFVSGIGSVLARQLIAYCGSASEVFRKRKSELERIPGIGRERAMAVGLSGVRHRAEQEILFLKKHSIQAVPFMDSGYPRRLRQCDDAPVVMFYKGNATLNPERTVAVVGTRRITAHGKVLVDELVLQLAHYGVTVVSGLAYGVDVAAHRASLLNDLPTIGVVAHGLDRIYPRLHRSVALQMIERGGLLSEFPSTTRPDRDNFPARNRIVAGMTDATIVVESAVRGGAMITAEFANDYNRDVFAFPGRPDDEFSRGCNALIRMNKAMLVDSGHQIAEIMNWAPAGDAKRSGGRQLALFAELDPAPAGIANFLRDNGPGHLDEIAWKCGLPVSKTAALLLELEFKGLVRAAPGKIFRLS